MCDNETIHGVEFPGVPTRGPYMPELVSDMTSNFLSRPIDVSKYGIIYAGSQKNYGPPGLAIVIIKDALLAKSSEMPGFPSQLSYKHLLNSKTQRSSVPSVFALLFTFEFLKFMKAMGGLRGIDKLARAKSQKLYNVMAQSSGFYKSTVDEEFRSRMNIPFLILKDDKELTKKFLRESTEQGLLQLKGHSSVGGLRASVYNGMPMEGVEKLCQFMRDFQKKYHMSPRL